MQSKNDSLRGASKRRSPPTARATSKKLKRVITYSMQCFCATQVFTTGRRARAIASASALDSHVLVEDCRNQGMCWVCNFKLNVARELEQAVGCLIKRFYYSITIWFKMSILHSSVVHFTDLVSLREALLDVQRDTVDSNASRYNITINQSTFWVIENR